MMLYLGISDNNDDDDFFRTFFLTFKIGCCSCLGRDKKIIVYSAQETSSSGKGGNKIKIIKNKNINIF